MNSAYDDLNKLNGQEGHMCKNVSYSKYQKRVIKFLNVLLGTHTPFSFERTQSNHLKVLIEGVNKPLYTGSTPSDSRSINNFMAEVKKELRLSVQVLMDDAASPSSDAEKSNVTIQSVFRPCYDKLIQTCIKSLRTQVASIKEQEQKQVAELNDVEFIKVARLKAVKHSISHVLQTYKHTGYIKPKAMREIETAILKHFNFMLPSIAFYSDLLDPQKISVILQASAANQEDKGANLEPNKVALAGQNVDKNIVSKSEAKPFENRATKQKEHQPKFGASNQLLSLSTQKRVNELRSLSSSQALELIKDVEQAMKLNREQDIEAVVALIQERAIPVDVIIARLEAA